MLTMFKICYNVMGACLVNVNPKGGGETQDDMPEFAHEHYEVQGTSRNSHSINPLVSFWYK